MSILVGRLILVKVALEFAGLSFLALHLFMWLIILMILVFLVLVFVLLMTMRMEDALEEPLVLLDGVVIRFFEISLASNDGYQRSTHCQS